MEINQIVQQVLNSYGWYQDNIDELLSMGIKRDKALKIARNNYKDFIIN